MGPYPEMETELQQLRGELEDPYDCYVTDDPTWDEEVDGFGFPY